ncbi:beta-lysine acetyltransferase [Halalkalibacter wakoensis JCM 9140]|uniref:Beta-lysine acetyltransferase n=1 Tax=Halalkalibacter wakoensis JCM 9140 TaxID=1236970 RepID=W4PYQ4_9BACI|nr:putative beta-lysine N-acetyltransferase [Halalkalibacter wakoensis]GAE24936.1 beta-lysine acetyltransferase [Halalkalibacter wakoensis JCM 9140]
MQLPETKTLKGSTYMATVFLDYFNERLRVDQYRGNIDDIMTRISTMVAEHSFSKILFHSKPEDWKQLLSYGFELEAIFEAYNNGHDQYTMALYKTVERRTSVHWIKEDEILRSVYQKGRTVEQKSAPDQYKFRKATKSDATKLAMLYDHVFDIYPTPMNDPEYIKKVMKNGSIFYIVEYNQDIVSAASADVNKTDHNAEMTDCATLPEHRKFGLMKKLLVKLEEELRNDHIYCAFSIARSLSFGMNAAFFQLGYHYKGRLRNNCYIYDKLEDMNVWVKDLSSS